MNVVLMGVCGSGKTTVGQALARELGWRFMDGDDFHPPPNVAKMAAGIPLTDEDRWPWLDRLRDELAAMQAARSHAVLACSALKRAYRMRLARDTDARFVHLTGAQDLIASRLSARSGHYMPPSLLASQFEALEAPEDAYAIDISLPVDAQVRLIVRAVAVDVQGA